MILFLLLIAIISFTYKERKRAILAGTAPELEWEIIVVSMVACLLCCIAVLVELCSEIAAILTIWNYLT